jgi:hypothetical protein
MLARREIEDKVLEDDRYTSTHPSFTFHQYVEHMCFPCTLYLVIRIRTPMFSVYPGITLSPMLPGTPTHTRSCAMVVILGLELLWLSSTAGVADTAA